MDSVERKRKSTEMEKTPEQLAQEEQQRAQELQQAFEEQQQIQLQAQAQAAAKVQQQQVSVPQDPFSAFIVLENIAKEHRQQVNPRKKACKTAVEQTLKRQRGVYEHGEGSYFRLETTNRQIPIDDVFLAGAYITFELEEGRRADKAQGKRFAESCRAQREEISRKKCKQTTRVKHTTERPTELFFS